MNAVRLTFPAEPKAIKTEPPASGPPPAHFDPDPDVSAEIAVEDGVATEQEVAWVEWLREEPIAVESADRIEVEVELGEATSYFPPDDAPLVADPEDGTLTTLESALPDPRSDDGC